MIIGLLLAGGTSSRFQYGDKALYQDFPERCFETLSALVDKVFVSAKPSNLSELQKRLSKASFVLDQAPYINEGPLSALYALSSRCNETCDVLILSVDNPEVSAKSLQLLLAEPKAYVDDYYTIAHLSFEPAELASFLASGQRRMRSFLRLLKAQPISFPAEELIDHNKK